MSSRQSSAVITGRRRDQELGSKRTAHLSSLCLLGNGVAGFTDGPEARDGFTGGGNNGTVGAPETEHIKII